MIMLQKNHAQVEHFKKEIEGLENRIEKLKQSDSKNDKSFLDLKLKNFFYRLHI